MSERDPAPFARADRSSIPRGVRDAIVPLHGLDERQNVRIALLFAIWAGFAVLAASASGLWLVLACLAIGCAIVGLSVMMHDAAHSLLVRSRPLNSWLGVLCATPVLVSFTAYRCMHLAHHRHTGREQDPDDPEAASARMRLPLGIFYSLYALVGTYPYLFHIWIEGFRLADRRQRARIGVEAALLAGTLWGAAWLTSGATVARAWLLPWLVAAHLSSLRGIAEHGLTTGGNPFTNARTVVSCRAVRLLLCNVNYHLEHHLFAGVPWYHLPKLHELLVSQYGRLGACVHPSYTAFYRDFLRCLRVGIRPRARLVSRDGLVASGDRQPDAFLGRG